MTTLDQIIEYLEGIDQFDDLRKEIHKRKMRIYQIDFVLYHKYNDLLKVLSAIKKFQDRGK